MTHMASKNFVTGACSVTQFDKKSQDPASGESCTSLLPEDACKGVRSAAASSVGFHLSSLNLPKTSKVWLLGMRWLKQLRAVSVLLLLVLFSYVPLKTAASPQNKPTSIAIKDAESEAPGIARFIRDEGDASIIEFSGDYSGDLTAPRETVAKEFFRTHADVYDFLVVFTSFDFPAPSGIAGEGETVAGFHRGIRNSVSGIGLEQYDYSRSFGSQGILQGYIDMEAVTHWTAATSSPDFDTMLAVFAHELQHQWGSYVKFRDWNGQTSGALLGRDGSHWSYLLDTQGSVEYGASWRDNGDGSFTAVDIRSIYSPLDLYLAGLLDKSKVPPFTLIEAPDIDPTALPPSVGTTVRGIKHTVTIDDITAVEGPRVPAADVSQKSFRFAFIYLVRSGETVDPAQLNVVAQARRQVGLRYNALTHGMGTANVFTEPATTTLPGLPATILPPGAPVSTTPGSNEAGLAWLKNQQKSDGSFMDAVGTAPRETFLARSYFRAVDPVYSGLGTATTWIATHNVSNTDFLARKLIESTASERRAEDVSALSAARNADGGWGLGENLRSNPLDTALAIQGLRLANADDSGYKSAVDLLLTWQNPDGGWGNAPASPSRVNVTSQVLNALVGLANVDASLSKAKLFLKSRQNFDGGFGDGDSSIHDTANAALAMSHAGFGSEINMAAAQHFVLLNQRVDGSWQGSVYSTVLAMQLLRNASAANLAIGNLQASPLPIFDGQRVSLSATVSNAGSIQSQATTVRFFDGDPSAGGVAIGEAIPIPALVGTDNAAVQVTWDTTSRAGEHTVYAVVDFEQTTGDLILQDNTTSLALKVESASPLADVLLGEGDVLATPSTVSTLPATIQIDALISNAGLAGVSNATAVLWSGVGTTRTRVGETTFNVAARATTAVQFKPTLTTAGTTVYTVELDPDGLLNEATHANNSGSVTVKTVGGVSLAVDRSDITLSPDVLRPGSDVEFSVRLHNMGTQDSTSFNVRYSIRSSDGTTTPILTNVVQIAAGGSTVQKISWRAAQGGSYSFIVEMDPEKTSGDSDFTDNTAAVDFNVVATAGLNLAVSYKDLTFTPDPALEGYDVALSALVRNVGDVAVDAASSIKVEFYDGDPNAGGTSIGSTTIDPLSAGGSAAATVHWEVPTAAERLIFVVVDPEHTQTDETILDDNTAFANLTVLTLPDFAISQGALTLSPSVPKPGEATTLTVNVSNLGEQAAENLVISVFNGSQDGGVKLAPDQVIPALASKANTSVQFSFNAPDIAGLGIITVVVNPDLAIKERVRDNNTATIALGIQNGDFALSESYISPNGDGVKDNTVLTYRLPGVMPVSAQVTDDRGNVVRSAGPWGAASTGSWQWDGLDNDGRLVQDGKYELTVRNADNVVLGGATVEVDTNRNSLLAAIGQPVGINAGLTCTLPTAMSSVVSIRDGAGFYLSAPTARNVQTDLQAGIYREDDWVRGIRLVLGGLLPTGSDIPAGWDSYVANEQGTRIVAYNRTLQQLVSAGGEGESKKVIFNRAVNSLIGLSPDSNEVFVVLDDGSLSAIDTNTGAQRALGIANVYNIRQSPDKQRLIVDSSAGGTYLLDTADSVASRLPSNASGYYWSPNGVFVVGAKSGALLLLDASGSVYDEIDNTDQGGTEAWTDDSSELYIPIVPACADVATAPEKCTVVIRRIKIGGGGRTDFRPFAQQKFAANENILKDGSSVVVVPSITTLRGDLKMVPGRYELLLNLYSTSTGNGQMTVDVHASDAKNNSEFHLLDKDGGSFLGYHLIDLRSSSVTADLSFGVAPPAPGSSQFIEYGRGLQYQGSDNPAQLPACVSVAGNRNDSYVFRTLANLQTDLALSRQADGVSVKIHGGVADKNFSRYWLDYASDDAPDAWHPVISASTTPVWDKDLTLWIAPGTGRYTIRMTAEDLAGNQKQKLRGVTIGDVGPPITNVIREPAYISPNGDGSNDEMKLSYRVLEPVNLEFNIYNQQGSLVRTISRSHPVGAVDADIVWDGRDGNGQVVADGEYRINVVGFDFFVTVDSTAPVINALKSGAPFYSPVPYRTTELRWSVADANFDSVQLEVGDGASPSQWRPFALDATASRLSNNLEGTNAVYLPLADYAGKRYRLTVTDLAGNRTVAQFDPAQEQAKLILAGQILSRNLEPGEAPPAPTDHVGKLDIGQQFDLDPALGIALVFAETLDDPVVAVSVQFNEDQLAQQGEWLEQPNVQVYPLRGDEPVWYLPAQGDARPGLGSTTERSVLEEGSSIPQNYGMVSFFNSNFSANQGLRLRLKLIGRSGAQYFTNEIVAKKTIIEGISVRPSVSDTNLNVIVMYSTPRVVREVAVYASSQVDPYYVIEHKIFDATPNSSGNGVMLQRDVPGRYVSCAAYNFRAVLITDDGQATDTASSMNCGGVKFRIRPDFATSCGESAPLQLHGFATPVAGPDGAVPLLSLEIFAISSGGGQQLVYNVVNPEYKDYEFSFSDASFQEGNITLVGVTTDRDGVKRTSNFVVPVDHTPVTLNITYPQENQRVCAIPELRKRGQGLGDEVVNVLRPVAEINDGVGFDYIQEFRLGDDENASWQAVYADLPSIYYPDPKSDSIQRTAALPYAENEYYYSQPSQSARSYMSGKRIAGELGPITNISGQVTTRVTAYDWSGAKVCRQVSFYLDGSVDFGPASVDQHLFSPGTSSSFGNVVLSVNPAEPLTVTAVVRRIEIDSSGRQVVVGPENGGVVRKLATNLSVATGQSDLIWDGKDDSGNYVVDGLYTFDITYEDGCGNLQAPPTGNVIDDVRRSLLVEVDRTPPALVLDRPVAGDVTSLFLDIFGSATDKNMQQWTLEYNLDSVSDVWTILASQTTGVDLRKLATLDANQMQGVITLRFRAVDKVGLETEVTRNLRLVPPVALIKKFSATPDPVSPNGDGRRDALNIVYDVFQSATLDMTVKLGGTPIRKLLTQSLAVPGEKALTWDGLDDGSVPVPDGEYTVEIRATSSVDPTNVQTEQSTVLLDTTPPLFTLISPLQPFMPGNAALKGSVADLALSGYQVYVEGPLPSGRRVLLTEGSEVISGALLGTLDQLGLDDANYRIRVLANDVAENATNYQSPDFELDSKAPTVSFSNPVSGTFVSRVRPANITGLLEDINLLSAELKINDSSVSSQTVATSSVSLSFAFDGASLPDGSYATQLIGTDKAGNVGQALSSINVDNTPPTALITVPAANTPIGAPVSVVGTASDANMESWKLELGSGVGQSLENLTVIGRGTDSIDNGELAKLIGLPPDGPATLRLTVEDKGGNVSVYDVPLQIDATPPNPPVLSGQREQRSNVRLNWTSADGDPALIAGYYVYRNDIKINEQPLTEPQYLDVGLVDGSYAYTVTALSRSGVESAPSNLVTIVISASGPLAQITKPATNTTVGGLVSIEGSAYAVTNFRSYTVSVGVGTAPDAWTVLRTSPLPVQGDVLASWSTIGLPDGAIYTIRLAAEDVQGGSSLAQVTVTIDNQAPASPLSLQAQLVGANDVSLNWTANTEPDLAGYLLYRDGQLVNQIDANDNSIRPYLLSGTTYLDKARPDGTFVYTVVAVDQADNLSSRSNPASVVVDNRPPHAVITKPADGADVDGVVYVQAISEDTDIATVRFEYKSSAAADWIVIPGASSKAPYSVNWDTQGVANGTYQLRAVATDLSGHTDPAPTAITVERKSLDRPQTPSGLTALVDGGDVTLNWSASESSDVLGYQVERIDVAGTEGQNTTIRLTTTPVTVTTFVDKDRPDGNYQYQVLAVDNDNNESDPTPALAVVVYTTKLKQPYTPVAQESSSVTGSSVNATDSVTLVSSPDTGTPDTQSLTPDAEGHFSADVVPLAKGANVMTAQQTDAMGNRSKAGTARVARGDPPAAPATVTAVASGSVYQATWAASASADVAGYVVQLDQQPDPQPFSFITATASTIIASYDGASSAIDSNNFSYWQPAAADVNASIELGTAHKELMTELSIVWSGYVNLAPPKNFVVEAWDGYVWVPLREETANVASSVQLVLDPPYYTDRIRISLPVGEGGQQAGMVSEVQGKSLSIVAGTTANVAASDGTHTVSVRALSTLGLLGAATTSDSGGIGDVTAPPPVVASVSVAGAMATVSWTESVAPDLAQYQVLRDGVAIGTVPASEQRVYVDGPLANGHYIYTVRPVDRTGNVGELSNEAPADIASALPGAPLQLSLEAPPSGGVLRLNWQAPVSGGTAACYDVYRGIAAGGPYDLLSKTDFQTLTYSDTTVVNGTRYYYVVRACDAAGNEGDASNEVNGVAADLAAPLAPVIFYPTDSEHPISTSQSNTPVRVFSEPAAQVVLSRDGVMLSSVTALESLGSTSVSGNYTQYWAPAPRDDLLATLYNGTLTIRRVVPALDGSTSATVLQAVPGLSSATGLAWSSDATQLALPINSFGVKVVQASDGSVASSAFTSTISALAWYPDGTRWLVITNSGRELAEVQVSSGTSRTIATASSQFLQFAISPDGQNAAVMDGATLEILSMTDGRITKVTGPTPYYYGPELAWASDGASLFFLGQDPVTGFKQVYQIQLGQSVPIEITTQSNGVDHFSLSPVGSLAFLSGLKLQVLDSAGTVSPVKDLQLSAYGIQWANSGALLVLDTSGITSYLLPGIAIFPTVQLESGQNLLVAQATDAVSNTGPQSTAISVTYDAAQDIRPDFSVQTADVTVLPQVPTVGAATRITLVVNNLGAVAAPSANVRILAVPPSGASIELLNTRTTAMPAGGSQIFRADTAFNVAGDWQLSIAVDAANEVEESSEDNNVLVLPLRVVDATTARTVAVSVANASYPVGSTLTGSVALFNGQTDIAGQINLSIEDSQGYVVSTLPALSQSLLPYGGSRTVDFNWNVPAIFDGPYQVRAVWADGATVLAQATAPFQVTPNVQVSARINSDSAIYASGSTARIVAQIDPAGTSPTTSSAQASIRVLDAQGQTVLETTDAIGLVSATELVKTLDTSALSLGTYTVDLKITFGTQEVARASTAFEIVSAASPVPALAGDIVLDSASASYTGSISGTAVLTDTGGTDLGSLQYEVVVIDPRSNTVLARSVQDIASLARGANSKSTFSFTAAGMPIGTLWIQLRTTFVTGLNAGLLKQREVSLFELDPPTVVINQPVNGAYLRATQSVLAAATDLLSGVRNVEFQVDGGNWQAASLFNPVSANYAGVLPTLLDGAHRVAVRATDKSGNVSQPVQSNFVVDSVPPVIAISGVTETAYANPVTPVISVTDLNLSIAQISLDGEPYVSGTQITQPGAYVLQVNALDLAGNSASQTVRFSIAAAAADVTPPVIDIQTPLANAYFRRATTGLSATIVDAESAVAEAEFSIDGGAFAPLAIDVSQGVDNLYTASLDDLADGVHNVVVRASDTQGNQSSTSPRSFTVDNTPPVIIITDVAAGQYSTAVTPVISVTDAALISSSVTLNGVAYVSGTPIAVNGDYTLSVNAEDKAGNTATASLQFSIRLPVADTTPPVVFIEQPEEAAYIRSGTQLTVSATDVGSGVASVEQKLDAQSQWTTMSVSATTGKYILDVGGLPDGEHTATVRATDNEGNISDVEVRRFTVDNTAPKVVVSGVANDGQYSGSIAASIAISDAHLSSSSIMLNGTPYVSGSSITTPGLYTLTAAARDIAGNETIVSVKFQLTAGGSPKAPTVTITSPFANDVVKSGSALQASAQPFDNVSRVEMAVGTSASYVSMRPLGYGMYESSIPNQADGPITVRVRAVSVGGVNYPDVIGTFTVDNTPPVIDQLNVVEGGTYPMNQPILFRVTDEHLESVVSTFDGRPFTAGQIIGSQGTHGLQIIARDLAGNESEQYITFSATYHEIEPTAPVPVPVWPMNKAALALLYLLMALTARRGLKKVARR